jgi:hypothetical protein
VLAPIADVDLSGARDEVVELHVVEHSDPILVDDAFEAAPEVAGLSLYRAVHFVVD